jgi:8-oxo-dGTP diphosphatase
MKEVVVIIPYVGDRVLMQLRDDKKEIDFPGHWGFFGGSLDEGESAQEAATRELAEETGYSPVELHYLKTDQLWSLDDLTSHSFYCYLSKSLGNLKLNEGMDWGLFSIDDIQSNHLRSDKFSRLFPVIPHAYVVDTINLVYDKLTTLDI